MRKTFITSTLSGAIAIVAAIHLTACQSNDIAPDTPVQQNDLVNTSLAISIPQNAAGKNYKGLNSTTKVSSRASQEIVQGADNQFNVMVPISHWKISTRTNLAAEALPRCMTTFC